MTDSAPFGVGMLFGCNTLETFYSEVLTGFDSVLLCSTFGPIPP